MRCRKVYHITALASLALGGCAATSQTNYTEQVPAYASVAQRVVTAPAIVDLIVTRATPVEPERSGPLPMGVTRFYIEATVNSLIRGSTSVPPQLRFLADIQQDSRGRMARPKGARYFAFGRISGDGTLQLSGQDALLPYGVQTDALVRSVTREAVAIDAPPAITGVDNAVHVPGNIPGEGETQIFLSTAEQRPIAISILSRPGQERRWSVSLSEIVDEAASAPTRDSLLWYRLACGGLPERLPNSALSSSDAVNNGRAREDYQFVRRSIGTCTGRPPVSDAPLIMNR